MRYNPIKEFTLQEGEHIKFICNIPGLIDVLPYYYISSYGRVFSMPGNNIKELKPTLKDNALLIGLSDSNKKVRSMKVERLVLYYFGPYIPCDVHKLKALHIDGNRLNNNISNLRWATQSEILHCYRDMQKAKGMMTNSMATNIINDMKSGMGIPDIATKYGISIEDINAMMNNDMYKSSIQYQPNKKHLTESEIKEIYGLAKSGIPDSVLADRYSVTPETISNIRRLKEGYDKYITEDPVFRDQQMLSDEEALQIFNECNLYGVSGERISRDHNICMNTFFDIKFLRNGYYYLREKYNLTPYEQKKLNPKFDKEKYSIIRQGLDSGMTVKEVSAKYNIPESSIYSILQSARNREMNQ